MIAKCRLPDWFLLVGGLFAVAAIFVWGWNYWPRLISQPLLIFTVGTAVTLLIGFGVVFVIAVQHTLKDLRRTFAIGYLASVFVIFFMAMWLAAETRDGASPLASLPPASGDATYLVDGR